MSCARTVCDDEDEWCIVEEQAYAICAPSGLCVLARAVPWCTYKASAHVSNIIHQMRIDLPRMTVRINGHSVTRPGDVPAAARIWCTQASMALPFTLLQSSVNPSEVMIADAPFSPLRIDVSQDSAGTSAVLRKQLRMVHACNPESLLCMVNVSVMYGNVLGTDVFVTAHRQCDEGAANIHAIIV